MDDTGNSDMEVALKKDNILQIGCSPQTGAEQEREATRKLAETLKDLSDRFRENVKTLIHSQRQYRIEKSNHSMRVLFLEGEIKAQRAHIKQMLSLYRTAQTDYMSVKRALKIQNDRLKK